MPSHADRVSGSANFDGAQMTLEKSKVQELLDLEEKIKQQKKCTRCDGKGYWRDEHPFGYDNVACEGCTETGFSQGISNAEFGAAVKSRLKPLALSWLAQRDEIEQLRNENNKQGFRVSKLEFYQFCDDNSNLKSALAIATEALVWAKKFMWPTLVIDEALAKIKEVSGGSTI